MSLRSAEQNFRKGLAALAESRPGEAADLFMNAMQIQRLRGAKRPDMRYLSYYGLSLARSHRATPAAIRACELAAKQDPGRPSLLLNLGRVYLLAGKTASAIRCFEGGLALAPDHQILRQELRRSDRRSRPLVESLGRCHPLNRWVGRLRTRLRQIAAALPPIVFSSPHP